MGDFTNIKLDFAKIQPGEYQLTPRELALAVLGYIPDGTPETWNEVNDKLMWLHPDWKAAERYSLSLNSFGIASASWPKLPEQSE